MTCREATTLLPLFFDGELDPRQMRVVALHSTRCDACESELRRLERTQELVGEHLRASVDEIDFTNFWPAVDARLRLPRHPWGARVRAWWAEREGISQWGIPALAGAAVMAVLAFLLLARAPHATQTAPAELAAVDNGASIESLDSDLDSVAVLNDPETRTTVLWVSEDSIDGATP